MRRPTVGEEPRKLIAIRLDARVLSWLGETAEKKGNRINRSSVKYWPRRCARRVRSRRPYRFGRMAAPLTGKSPRSTGAPYTVLSGVYNEDVNVCAQALRLVIEETKKTLKVSREITINDIADVLMSRIAQKELAVRRNWSSTGS